ncbi:MAG: hypothetical protein ACXITV_01135 [Luteibaculaceae bacterium]
MQLESFLKQYDFNGSVVLLEGKREVLPQDELKLVALGRKLCQESTFIQFRSGNAKGADAFFAEGVVSVDPKRLEVIVPYTGHRDKQNLAYKTHSLNDINLAEEPDILYKTLEQSKSKSAIRRYATGKRDRFSLKAAYLLRDTAKVLGSKSISKASFALFYDDLGNPVQGGTGHTMMVCKDSKVPYLTQETWFTWL